MWAPSDDDAFWLLLLHCLLDKQNVPAHYRERLVDLAGRALADGPFGRLAQRICPDGWTAGRLLEVSRSGDWSTLETLTTHISASWQRQLSPPERARSLMQ